MRRPNLLFLFTDEQRRDTLGAYGNSLIQTPNLDRLAARSTVFERAYVTQPVCTPSRSTLLTGLYPHQNGCVENNIPVRSETPCFPELLPSGSHVCGYHGKWHLGDEIFAQHGFTDWVSVDDGYAGYYGADRDPEARSTYHAYLLEQGFRPANGARFTRNETAALPEEHSKPAYLAREASRFILEHRDEPFALFVNFFEPHMPFTGPRDGQYDRASIPLPPNFDSVPGPGQPLKARLFHEAYRELGMDGPLLTADDWRDLIARYWGLCSQVDTHAGSILETLKTQGLWDDTVIVYTSDHGDMMGSHQLVAKCVMYEEAVSVPLIVKLQGQREGSRVSRPVSQVDLVPTLLDALGAPGCETLPGSSWFPALTSDGDVPGGDVFVEWQGHNNGFGDRIAEVVLPDSMTRDYSREEAVAATRDPVRTLLTPDGWKFNCSQLGEHELYSLQEDPGETANLAGDPVYRATMQELLSRIRSWQAAVGDAVTLPDVCVGPA